MKIGLNLGQHHAASPVTQNTATEAEILAAKKGDWVAKKQLAKKFSPLIQKLAKKRTDEQARINAYVEAGQEGLFLAAKKYKKSIGADKFSVFCLNYIQAAMDQLDKKSTGILARLFSRS